MPAFIPLVFAALGLGSIGFGAYAATKKPKPETGRPMPPALASAYQTLLMTGKDPAAMEQMATTLDGYGYKESAAQLRERAAELRKAAAENKPAPPPLPPVTSSAPSVTVILGMVNTATDPLVLRSSPSTSGAVLATMPKGAMVQILNPAASPGWAQVSYQGKTGYASSQYIKMPSAALPPSLPGLPSPTPTTAAQVTATVTGTGVNMRSAPSTTAGVVSQLNKPEIVNVLNWNAATAGGYSWAQVARSSGQSGFVAKNYLSLNAPSPPAVSGEDMAFIGADEDAGPRPARCVSPGGCRLRNAPSPDAGFKSLIANSQRVTVLKQMPGPKAERNSPGPGGWSLVRAGKNIGWVPSEWLLS